MNTERSGEMVQRAAIGDPEAIAWLHANAEASADVDVKVVAALLRRDRGRLDVALATARTRRHRQMAAIGAAHLNGERDRVDVLARDHLLDYPDCPVVAWIVRAQAS